MSTAKKLSEDEVIALALASCGYVATPDDVAGWRDDGMAPAAIATHINSILENMDKHIDSATAKAAAMTEVTEAALRGVASIPVAERKRVTSKQFRDLNELYTLTVNLALNPEAYEAFIRLARAMRVSRSGFASLVLAACVSNAVQATADLHCIDRNLKKPIHKRMTSSGTQAVKLTVRRLQDIEKKSEEEANSG